jgi:thiol:disulfide interchange protein DsbD
LHFFTYFKAPKASCFAIFEPHKTIQLMFRKLLFFAAVGLLFFSAHAQELHAHWSIKPVKVSDCEYDIVFSVKIDEPWHIYSIVPTKDGPNPTKIKFNKSDEYEVSGKLTESKPIVEMDPVFEAEVRSFDGKATFTQRIKALRTGKITLKGKYEYQICTDAMCEFPPAEKFSVDVDIPATASCIAAGAGTGADTSSKDTSRAKVPVVAKADTMKKAETATVSVGPATTNTANDNECDPWGTLLIGLGYGFAAVLMPCIYSLIPLTVSFFMKQSKTRAMGIRNALFYGFFIMFIFVALTMIITVIAGPTALSKIATNTILNLIFFALFVAFALSFFGLFEITLPSSWANKIDAKADRGGIIGIFFMALTLVIVSFSCTVGFMGNLLTQVAKGDSYICPLMGFTGFGAGIAFPFMLFAFFPSWLKSLPKSGGWMTTFKVTVAFIELALAVKFLSNADNVNEWGLIKREIFIALWIGIFAMLTFYLLGVFRTSHDDAPGPLSIGRIMWATVFLSFTLYLIPGLWGAPLKLISSFPPPHDYAESPEGVGKEATVVSTGSSGNSQADSLANLRVTGPEGLKIFKDDYNSALKYARLVNKPLFVDFTGKACVNCRWMESHIWVTPEVKPLLRDSVVIVSLYVDSNVDLPKEEQKTVFYYGKERELETIGEKWAYLQISKYNSSSQPQYVLLNHDESNASVGTKGTEENQQAYADWIKQGLKNFKKSNPAETN